jgi:hypothetical protein
MCAPDRQAADPVRKETMIPNQAGRGGSLAVPSVWATTLERSSRATNRYELGTVVEAQYGASFLARNPTAAANDFVGNRRFSPARVLEAHLDGTYHLHYVDGCSEDHVYPAFMREARKSAHNLMTCRVAGSCVSSVKAAYMYDREIQLAETRYEQATATYRSAVKTEEDLQAQMLREIDIGMRGKLECARAVVQRSIENKFADQLANAAAALRVAKQELETAGECTGGLIRIRQADSLAEATDVRSQLCEAFPLGPDCFIVLPVD